jgi:hypothetical protein
MREHHAIEPVHNDVKFAVNELARWVVDLGIGFVGAFRLDGRPPPFFTIATASSLVTGSAANALPIAAMAATANASGDMLSLGLILLMLYASRVNLGEQ